MGEFQEEDKKVREKIEARNALEKYVYSMKNTLSDSEKGVADKIGDDDKETIEKALEEANEWLDDNQEAEKEDFEEKLKEVTDVCSPIISKVYKESGGAPGGGDFGGDDDLDGTMSFRCDAMRGVWLPDARADGCLSKWN